MTEMAQVLYNLWKNILQHHLNILEDWFIKWKIKVNTNKCHAIYFSRSIREPSRLYLFDNVINWENTAVYLGVTLDRRLTWRSHIFQIVRKIKIQKATLRLLFFGRHLSDSNKILLWKSILLPIALYACPVWLFAARSNLDKIESALNGVLRRIRHAHRHLSNTIIRRDFNVLTFAAYARENAANFFDTLGDVPNELLENLPDYDPDLPINARRPRAALRNS